MISMIPEPSSFMIFGAAVLLLFVMTRLGRKDHPNLEAALDKLGHAEEALSDAYGGLPPLERARLFFLELYPYLFLLFFAETSRSFSIFADIFNGSFTLSAIRIFRPAYADDSVPAYNTVHTIFSLVFLVLFVIAFLVTLRDEFFTAKPRPISKDLNRAFIGFVIGQLTKLGL